ncbi:MAG: glycosyltransferase family 9 protein [Bacteroidaceae bacterium]|nr:glycosyltransferase family 9 protein [Bacteroidaceae bacterium]
MLKNILVIRFRRVGDSVLSMALCHSLKASFPQAAVHFVINEETAPLYQGHPDIDKVIPFNPRQRHGWSYVRRVRQVVTDTHYDAIIDMRSTSKTLLFALLSPSTPYRIGRRKWYNRLVHNYRPATPTDTDRATSNLALMQPLSREGRLTLDPQFRLYVTEAERTAFRTYMAQQGIDFGKPVILGAVSTRIVHKALNPADMTDTLRRVLQKYDVQIIANYGGPAEKAMALRYKELLAGDPRFFVNIEAKSLRELCALCANCQFFFGNEGGPRHMAQAMGIPAFAIYPPGISKTKWLPSQKADNQGISPDDYLSQAEQEGMTYQQRFQSITPQRVWEHLDSMLAALLPQK